MSNRPEICATDALEAEALREPTAVRTWIHLIQKHCEVDTPSSQSVDRWNRINTIFERALMHNPTSYKLWMSYITARRVQWTAALVAGSSEPSVATWHHAIGKLYERALFRLPQMPLLWVAYLSHLMLLTLPDPLLSNESEEASPPFYLCSITKVRVTLLRAVAALPITQHQLVWGVFRKWCATTWLAAAVVDRVPECVMEYLWDLLLQSNSSDRALSEYLQLLTRRRAHTALLRCCCNRVSNPTSSGLPSASSLPRVFRDPVFWELLSGVLLEAGTSALATSTLHVDGTRAAGDDLRCLIPQLRTLVVASQPFCLKYDLLVRSFAVLLMRLGEFQQARDLLGDVVNHTSDPVAFQDAFSALLNMEVQLVDCIALSPALADFQGHELDAWLQATKLIDAKESADADPLQHVKRLVLVHPLLLNAVQLRRCPHDVRLWLKRVELVMEAAARKHTAPLDDEHVVKDLDDVFQQAFSLCRGAHSSGPNLTVTTDGIDPDTKSICRSALFVAYAKLFMRSTQRRPSEIVAVLRRGAFYATFDDASCRANVMLFGLLIEILCLTETSPADVLTAVMTTLRQPIEQLRRWRTMLRGDATGSTSHQRMLASSLFQGVHFTGEAGEGRIPILEQASMWTLCLDVASWAEGAQGPATSEICTWMAQLGLYSPSVAILRAQRLYSSGHVAAAFSCLDDATCGSASTDSAASLVLADAYCGLFLDHALRHAPRRQDCAETEPRLTQGQPLVLVADALRGFPRLERLREILRRGIRSAHKMFHITPRTSVCFLFASAASEERLGLHSECLHILRETMYLSSRLVSSGGSSRPSDEDDEGGVTFSEEEHIRVFVACLETYSRKLLTLRGATLFFKEMAELLKVKLPPQLVAEVVLRFTAVLAQWKLLDKCRAVFSATCGLMNVATPHGAIFWAAWDSFERDMGTEESFTAAQRKRRNVQATFSKVEVTFES